MFVQESSAAASANIHTLKDLNNKYKKVYITVILSLFCATWKMKKVCIMYKQKNSTLV